MGSVAYLNPLIAAKSDCVPARSRMVPERGADVLQHRDAIDLGLRAPDRGLHRVGHRQSDLIVKPPDRALDQLLFGDRILDVIGPHAVREVLDVIGKLRELDLIEFAGRAPVVRPGTGTRRGQRRRVEDESEHACSSSVPHFPSFEVSPVSRKDQLCNHS